MRAKVRLVPLSLSPRCAIVALWLRDPTFVARLGVIRRAWLLSGLTQCLALPRVVRLKVVMH